MTAPGESARRIIPIRWRIILPFALLTTTASVLFGWVAERRVAEQVERDIRGNLAHVVDRLAASGAPLEGRYIPFIAEMADARILILDLRGGILNSSLGPGEAWAWARALERAPALRMPAPEERRVAELAVGRETFLVASKPVPGQGIAVLAAVSRARVVQTQKAATDPVLWLVGLQGLAALAIGAAVAGSLTRPLGRLAAYARQIAAGDLSGKAPVERLDEIGVLARTLDRMTASLREAQANLVQAERMATLGRLATGLAHEIRNPLSSIRMHVQILGRHPGVEPATRDLVLREIDRLDAILSELLSWAKPSGISPGPADLKELAEEALALVGPQLAHRGIRVATDLQAVPGIQADRDRLRQVLRNLLTNAQDALGTGGTISVVVAPAEGGGVRLEVADDGPGIPPEIRDKAFEPFVTGRKGGTGLGLTIVKRAVEEHGGTVVLETGARGTRFRILLPPAPPG